MLNIGIIGFGKMGKIRKQTLDSLEDCKVTHICDVKEASGDFKFTKDYQNIIGDKLVDAIFVCTPNYLTKDVVVSGLDAHKHVFAEKPPGISVAQVKEMITAEERNPECKLKFGFNHRYHDSMIEAKKRIDSGEFGKILWMRGRYGKSTDRDFKNTWRAKKKYAGGGIFMDQGIHMLDLFLMFCDDFEDVKSFVSNLYWNMDIEDNVFALLRNTKGQVASLHSTMTQWRHLFALEIFLERGYMVINGILSASGSYGNEVMSIAANRSASPEARHTKEEKFTYGIDNSWKEEIKEFIEAIRDNSPIKVGTTQDALKLMKLIERIYEDGK